MNYIPTHLHTDASLLDGLSKVKEVVAKVKSLGMTSCAITDHGSLGNTYSFWKECKANGIKPLLGNELYYTHDSSLFTLICSQKKRHLLSKKQVTL